MCDVISVTLHSAVVALHKLAALRKEKVAAECCRMCAGNGCWGLAVLCLETVVTFGTALSYVWRLRWSLYLELLMRQALAPKTS
jgi:hypothetical protein